MRRLVLEISHLIGHQQTVQWIAGMPINGMVRPVVLVGYAPYVHMCQPTTVLAYTMFHRVGSQWSVA